MTKCKHCGHDILTISNKFMHASSMTYEGESIIRCANNFKFDCGCTNPEPEVR